MIGLVAIYLVCVATIARALMLAESRLWPWYVILQAAFLALFTLVFWKAGLPRSLLRALFVLECVIVVFMLALNPERDFVSTLFVALSYQAAIMLGGRECWGWVTFFALGVGVSLMAFLGPLRGLALALVTMTGCAVLPTFAAATRQIELGRLESQRMIGELEESNAQLQEYAAQVAELAGVEERNRLARELHDSVSQAMFSIGLATRSAEILLKKDPAQAKPQLEQLQTLTADALGRMRGFIAELRPKPTT